LGSHEGPESRILTSNLSIEKLLGVLFFFFLAAYKLAIGPSFSNPTTFKDNDPLCASDCRQSVSNDQYRGLPGAKNLVNGIIYLEIAKLAVTHPKKTGHIPCVQK
jgi:hypothetical protein